MKCYLDRHLDERILTLHQSNEEIEIRYLDPLTDLDEVRTIWLELQENSTHSFFTSWGWIGTWLANMPSNIPARLVLGVRGSETVFCCVLVEKRSTMHLMFHKNRAFVNATGDPVLDGLTIEYNGLLVRDAEVLGAGLLSHSRLSQIEEFRLPGADPEAQSRAPFDETFFVRAVSTDRSYFVDLDDVRGSGDPYLQRLSSSRRGQIRKSIRKLSEIGEIEVREAADVDEALSMLISLADFHQSEWVSRGKPGAFASDYFFMFHKDLIRRRFSEGEIQMLAITAGKTPIGYLYNFVYRREVLFYQSGFNYAAVRNSRPGVVSHVYSIQHNLDKGLGKYNFLAGDAQYKKSLSTGYDTLEWLVASRKNIKSRLENFLRNLKGRAAGSEPGGT